MNAREAIRETYAMPDFVWKAYLQDLSDEDLLVRPVPGANHVKWQLGHLISSEHAMIETVSPGSMPPLPEGFAEQHTKEKATLDDPAAFLSRDEYLRIYEKQRAGTLAALERQSDEDLARPSPERFRRMWPTVAAIFTMQPSHWMMHAGQWAILRRKLGKPTLI